MNFSYFIVGFFFFLMNSNAYSQSELVSVSVPEISFVAGTEFSESILVMIKEGYHIQANLVDDEYLVPTTLEIDPYDNIVISEPVFPESKNFRLEGSDDYLKVYDGDIDIDVTISTNNIINKGEYLLDATLTYQACDSKSCFAPKTINFSIPVKVIK